jgi:polar amino acid transport system substrate-binding protein
MFQIPCSIHGSSLSQNSEASSIIAKESVRLNNPRMRYTTTFLVVLMLSATAVSQSPSMTLAPTGTLRAVFLGTNPVHGRVDSQTGVATGPVPDLVKELASRLGVPYKVNPAPDATGVIEALRNHTADIGFLAYDETRALEVDFGAAFVVMFNSYLVRADSPLQKSGDVDREGVRVAAVKGQTQELFVSSHLKNAKVRVFATMPPQAELETLLTSGEVDAFAINRTRSLDAQAASSSRLRALPDSFMEVDQAFVVEKGASAKLEAIEKFVAEVRASGFIKSSIERARLTGVDVPSGNKK